jgi:hypothetical protein
MEMLSFFHLFSHAYLWFSGNNEIGAINRLCSHPTQNQKKEDKPVQKKTGILILMLALALFASAFAGCSRSAYLFPNRTGTYPGTGTYTGTAYNDTYYDGNDVGYNGTSYDTTTNPRSATRLSTTNDLPPVGTTNSMNTPGLNGTNGYGTNGYGMNGYGTTGYGTNGYGANGYGMNGTTGTIGSASQIAARLRTANILDFSNMTVLTPAMIRSRLNLDPAMFEDYYFLDSANNLGQVIYIAKVRNATDKQTVRNAFQSKLSALNDSTLATMPDKTSVSRSGKIVESGNYIMLVASDRQQAIVNSFNQLFR